jgi:hypothetical protein
VINFNENISLIPTPNKCSSGINSELQRFFCKLISFL